METPFQSKTVRLPVPLLRGLLGLALLAGNGTAGGQALDAKQIKAQAEAGNPKAQNTLGAMYNLGQEVPENHAEAVKWFRKAADQQDPEACYNLGTMYLNGRGVTKDVDEAVKWIRRSAQKGFAMAQFGLGVMYQKGNGVVKDPVEAANWYFRAAEQGHTAAQYTLGMMYFQAQGVPQDYISAFTLFSLASKAGVENAPEARELVSQLMSSQEIKEGIRRAAAFQPKKPAEVAQPKPLPTRVQEVKAPATRPPPTAPPGKPDLPIEELKTRAAQDDAEAQFNLATAYQAGRDVPQDFAAAFKWFSQAAQQGHGKAQRYLGSMYFQGQGVAQDFVTAYKWLDLAAAQKVANAPEARELVARLMSAEQVARGKQLAAEFKPGKPAAVAPPAPAPSVPSFGADAKAPAAATDVAALIKRGQMHATGQGVPQDLVEAEKAFRQAAEQGSAEAQATLGIMCLHGRGVRPNKAEAIKWLQLAADQNHATAQFWLGLADDKASDHDRAARYRKAAEQGYGPAQYALATLYAAGQGVPQDSIEAYKWFTLAAGQGNAHALAVRDTTAQFMTAEQVAEGKRRADGFAPRMAPPPVGAR